MNDWTELGFWKSETWENIQHELLQLEYSTRVFPPSSMRLNALKFTPFDKVKCVILGQDPYHGKGQAHGLAFSVLPTVSGKLPPSLRNILKEYQTDLGYPRPKSGCLMKWGMNGVLLWNTCLTVEENKPGSHIGRLGWEKLTIEVIQTLAREKKGLSFILWGKKAQEYRSLINDDNHLLIEAPHPSPYSADKGFFGHRPFTRTNDYIAEPIDWRL